MRLPEWRFGDLRLAASLVLVGAACFVFAPVRSGGDEPAAPERPVAEAVAAHPDRLADGAALGLREGSGIETATANRVRLQEIIDALAAMPAGQTLLLPPWPVYVDRMIELNADQLKVRGRPGSSLRMHGSRSDPLLYLGRLRRPKAFGSPPGGAEVRPEDVISLEPHGLPGRYALVCNPTSIVDPEGPIAHANVDDGFCAEFLLDLTEQGLPDYGPIGGVGLYRPWHVQMADGGLYLGLGVSDGSPESPVQYLGLRAARPSAGRLGLLTVQVDMTTARGLILWDSSVLFAGPIPGLAPGRKLVANTSSPFHLGAEGRSVFAVDAQNIRSDQPKRRVFGGFHLLRGTRYLEDGRRIDGKPRTLTTSLYEVEAATAGLLSMEADHAELNASRRVEIMTDSGVGHAAYFLSPENGSPWNNLGDYWITDAGLEGGGHNYGATVALPNVLYSGLRRCKIGGSRFAVRTWGASATYTFDVEDCWLIGLDTAILADLAILNVRRTKIMHVGRCGLDLTDSRVTVEDLFFNPNGRPHYLVHARRRGYVSEFSGHNIVSDWESREAPTVAGFRFEGEGTYRLEAPRFGWMPASAPLVWITTSADQPADLALTQCNWAHDAGEVVRVAGPVLVECDAGTRDRASRRGRPVPAPVMLR